MTPAKNPRNPVAVTVEADVHSATARVPLIETQGGVWIRCATCDGIHYTSGAGGDS